VYTEEEMLEMEAEEAREMEEAEEEFERWSRSKGVLPPRGGYEER